MSTMEKALEKISFLNPDVIDRVFGPMELIRWAAYFEVDGFEVVMAYRLKTNEPLAIYALKPGGGIPPVEFRSYALVHMEEALPFTIPKAVTDDLMDIPY
jgi:hypothetical protein